MTDYSLEIPLYNFWITLTITKAILKNMDRIHNISSVFPYTTQVHSQFNFPPHSQWSYSMYYSVNIDSIFLLDLHSSKHIASLLLFPVT